MSLAPPRRGALLVAAAAVSWSTGGLLARLVGLDPWTTSFWRCVFGALVLGAAVGRGLLRGPARQQYRFGWPVLAVALCLATASTCFILALSRTSVANTLIVMSTGPYIAGLLGWLLMGERVRAGSWLTMAVTLLGTATMVSGSWAAGALAGDLLALAMAGAFATGAVLVRAHPGVPMAPAAGLAVLLAALAALPLAQPLSAGARELGLLAIFGGAFAVGFLLFTAGAPLIPAAEASLIALLEIVLGSLWVWLALGERPGPASLVGGAIVLAALATHAAADLLDPGEVGGQDPARLPASPPGRPLE